MHDSANRGPALSFKLINKSAHLLFVRDVGGHQMHARARFFQCTNGGSLSSQVTAGLNRAPGGTWRELGASQKDQAASALRDHPARDHQAEVSETSGYQIAAVRAPSQRSLADAGFAATRKSRHTPLPVPEPKLILTVRTGDFLQQLMSVVAGIGLGIQVHQPSPECRMLLSDNSTQSPNRCLSYFDRLRILAGGLRSSSDQPQPRRLAPLDARHRLRHQQSIDATERLRRFHRGRAGIFGKRVIETP